MENRPSIHSLTPEQVKAHWVLPVVQKYRRSYPVLSIRQHIKRLSRLIRSGEIKFQVAADGAHVGAMASARQVLDQNVIILNRFRLAQYQDFHDQHTYEDLLIAVLLHELFHLEHHRVIRFNRDGKRISDRRDRSERLQNESECWWYTAKELLIPMRSEGRLAGMHPTGNEAAAIMAFERADKPDAEIWKAFVETVTP